MFPFGFLRNVRHWQLKITRDLVGIISPSEGVFCKDHGDLSIHFKTLRKQIENV